MRSARCLPLAAMWPVLWSGCSQPLVTPRCGSDDRVTCLCPDDSLSYRTCTEDGTWSTCHCGQREDGGAKRDADSGPPWDGGTNPCDGVDCSGHGQCQVQAGQAVCVCDQGYHPEGLACVQDSPCDGVDCSGHGQCQVQAGQAVCVCDQGYHAEGLACVDDNDPCAGQTCSGHGHCLSWEDGPVCVCDPGYTPSNRAGLDCVPTQQVCTGGPIDYDVDGDGVNENWFEPNQAECEMYELINRTRASHDPEGTPECHKPLLYDVLWSAHARNHSFQMQRDGRLFHADSPYAQNCAYGCDPACEMDMYMNGTGEGHCPPLSHHCNIMRCSITHVGVGMVGTWNTQNFF